MYTYTYTYMEGKVRLSLPRLSLLDNANDSSEECIWKKNKEETETSSKIRNRRASAVQ